MPWSPPEFSFPVSASHSSRVRGGRVMPPLEQVLSVDDDAVGRVPGDAVLPVGVPAGAYEGGQPRVLAPVAHRLQGEVGELAAVGVQRHLGVADLDDVGRVAGAVLEHGADLVDDAGPLLDADVQAQVLVGAFEVGGEAPEEVRGGAVLHEPHGHGLPLVPAGEHPAGAQEGTGDTHQGDQTTSHEGSVLVLSGRRVRTGVGARRGGRAAPLVRVCWILVWTNAEGQGGRGLPA